jgi:hypothetical protein
MISKNIKRFCKNYTQIENYNEAINDKEKVWDCHHRLELREDYINTSGELKLMNLYYDRPPEELIFLTKEKHQALHKNRRKSHAQVKDQKKREALLRYWHGPDWSEEDQEKFVRERNNRFCNKWREQNRDKYNACMKRAQDKWRAEHPLYYAYFQYKKAHPDTTYEWYVAYRKQKEAKKERNDG